MDAVVPPDRRNPFERVDPEVAARRPGTKWQRTPGALAAWVADMDIPPAGIIRRRLFEMLGRGDLGYPHWPRGQGSPAAVAFAGWVADRYGWQIDASPGNGSAREIVEFNDVVQGIEVMLHLCTQPGDGVILHTPAYPPMFGAIASAGCDLIAISAGPGSPGSPGALDAPDAPAAVDPLDDLAARLEGPEGQRARVLLLCHPHNPTGHVFTVTELRRLGEIAERHDLLIISDEIHADLEHLGHEAVHGPHVPMAMVSPEIAARTVTLHSASKAFNLAGLRYAVAHIGPTWLRERLAGMPSHLWGAPNLAGVTAAVAAWTEPEAATWLSEVRTHLDRQRLLLAELLAAHLPEVRYMVPEATYLGWIDARPLDLGDDPSEFWRAPERGRWRVDLSPGPDFGTPGYVRLNFATSAGMLERIVEAMARGLTEEK